MIDSAARAERFEQPAAPFYSWAVPQKPVTVRIPMPLVDKLEREAVESFRSLTSRGSEIGGVLLGTVAPGDPLVVSIAEYELVPCDYTRGPLYRLSDSDSARFDLIKVPSGMKAVGFFRSHTRKGLALDADDLALMEGRFREPYHIALVIRPNATKTSIGGIFIREAGSIRGESSYLEFPFRSAELAPTKLEDIVEPQAPPAAPPAPAPSAAKPPVRAQIVPIASRRDTPPVAQTTATPETPAPAPAPPPPAPEKPAPAPTPAPAAKAAPPVEKQVPVEAAKPAPPPPQAKPAVPPPQAAKPVPERQVPGKNVKPSVPEKPVTNKAPIGKPAEKPVEAAKAQAEPPKAAPAVEKPAAEAPKPAPAPEKPPVEASKPVPPPEKEKTPEKSASAGFSVKIEPKEAKSETQAEPAKPKKSGKAMWFAVGAIFPLLLSGVLFVSGVFHKGSAPTGKGQDSSALALHVERNAGELILTWNRDSEVIRNATRAVLQITDGQQHEDAQMDLAQLRMGSIQYSPATSDVVFSMEVWGKDQSKTTSELVRVMRTPRPSPLADDPQATSKNGQAPPAQQQQQVATAVPPPGSPAAIAANNGKNTPQANVAGQPPTPGQAPTPEQDPNAAQEEKVNLTRPTRQFNSASLAQRLRPVNPGELPDAPTVSGGGGVSSAPSGLASIPAALPPAPSRPEAPQVTATPAVPDKKTASSGGQIKQAELITRKNPEYPKLARDAGAKGAVELTATIGPDGRVKSVKVVSGHPLLQRAAIDAVMQWKYKPCMLNGTPVESQSQIVLNFVGDR